MQSLGVFLAKIILMIFKKKIFYKMFQIDGQMTVSTVIWLMSERSHVQCHAKWGLVEYIPELNIERFDVRPTFGTFFD